jgi:hypothetical protein
MYHAPKGNVQFNKNICLKMLQLKYQFGHLGLGSMPVKHILMDKMSLEQVLLRVLRRSFVRIISLTFYDHVSVQSKYGFYAGG